MLFFSIFRNEQSVIAVAVAMRRADPRRCIPRPSGSGHYVSRKNRNILLLYSDGSEANAGRDRFGNRSQAIGFPMLMRLNLLRAASNLTGWLAALKAVTASADADHHGARPARNVR